MPEFYVPNEARVAINGPVLIFSLAISVMTGILFGLAPAIQSSKPDLTGALKDAGRGSGAAKAASRLRSLLVVAEVTLSVVLLVSASLTIRSFLALQQVDPGFQTDAAAPRRGSASRRALRDARAAQPLRGGAAGPHRGAARG